MILANEESDSELQSIAASGGFYTQMSLLGCIGYVMSGSGLEQLLEVLEVVYAPNTVVHMLSRKTVSRAVRGHLLVDSVLNAMITAKALNILLPDVHAEKVQNRVINVECQTDADSPPEIPDQTYQKTWR